MLGAKKDEKCYASLFVGLLSMGDAGLTGNDAFCVVSDIQHSFYYQRLC
ncbi:hypothetical protein P4479_25010 [Brevibacillus agri]|nr:hypothetical protein [Brevibacillus agri]